MSNKQDKWWTDAIKRAVKQELPDGRSKLQGVAEVLVGLALNGDVQAIKEIGDRLDGRALQRQEVAGDEGGPVQIIIKKMVRGDVDHA